MDARSRVWMWAVLRWLLTVLMVVGGVMHFVVPQTYVAMMPAFLPWHGALVAISGVAEVLGGLGLVHPATRRWAAWGLVALLVAVFPANVNMAVNNLTLGGEPMSPVALWLRLPLQAVLVAWAWAFTRDRRIVHASHTMGT